jgi:predicted Zn-dependent protease
MSTHTHIDPATIDARILSREQCNVLAKQVIGYARGSGLTQVRIASDWTSDLRWTRNRITVASDRGNVELSVRRVDRGARAVSVTNQLDAHSLAAAVASADRELLTGSPIREARVEPEPAHAYSRTSIWDEPTSAQSADERTAALRPVLSLAADTRLRAAGYLGVTLGALAHLHSDGVAVYARYTRAQCSITVRNPEGTGSGWAGASSYAWAHIDPAALARIAVDKCRRSADPVAIEPGRYTAILEPQATYDLVRHIVRALDRVPAEWNRSRADDSTSPFWERSGYSKLGQRLLDERITLSHDPTDPALGVIPFNEFAWTVQPYRKVTWIDRGVLVTLADQDRDAALRGRLEHEGYPNSQAVRMSGGHAALDEMIASTTRGVLVTRFSGIQTVHYRSLLLTGYTRDGLWLIEKGKISKAIKNFRFTESPLFTFNNVEQLGAPTPVFNPDAPAVVPSVKVRDFSFTSLADAV